MSTPQQTASKTPRKYQLLIDGKWVDAESGKTFTTPNPATGETLAEVAEADKADVDKAVIAARKAYEGKWGKMSARDRGRLLYKLSQLIEEHSQELAELVEATRHTLRVPAAQRVPVSHSASRPPRAWRRGRRSMDSSVRARRRRPTCWSTRRRSRFTAAFG